MIRYSITDEPAEKLEVVCEEERSALVHKVKVLGHDWISKTIIMNEREEGMVEKALKDNRIRRIHKKGGK